MINKQAAPVIVVFALDVQAVCRSEVSIAESVKRPGIGDCVTSRILKLDARVINAGGGQAVEGNGGIGDWPGDGQAGRDIDAVEN